MARNYEIKCSTNDFRPLRKVISDFAGINYLKEKQIDIYYKVVKGRLKLRIINDDTGNLIFYERKETTSKRISDYLISGTKSFAELDEILRSQFEVLVIVEKLREIYIQRNIRIHLDSVETLGKFIEIEVINDDIAKAKKQMDQMIAALDLKEEKFVKCSYSDLLINKK